MLIVGISGKKGSGKDSAANAITDVLPGGIRIAFADALKKEAVEAITKSCHDYWKWTHWLVPDFLAGIDRQYAGCWLWKGATNYKGYGMFRRGEFSNCKAHRFMWNVVLGNSPEKMLMHTCDVRHCVNPLHLKPTTILENQTDMKRKGRSANGETHCSSTISDAIITEIKQRFAAGERQAVIVKKIGISSASVSRILNGLQRGLPPQVTETIIPKMVFPDEWLKPDQKWKFRNYLQRYGTEFRREFCGNKNYWINEVAKALARHAGLKYAVIPDVRFTNEYNFVRKNGGILIRIESRRCNMDDQHPSETELDCAQFDYTIRNDGTIYEFRASIGRIATKVITQRL